MIDIFPVYRVMSYAIIIGGIFVSYHYVRRVPKRAGVGAGLSSSIVGLVLLMDSYSLLPPSLTAISLLILTFAVVGFIYRISGRLRVFFLVGGLWFLIIRVNILDLSWALLQAYVAVSLAVFNSYDYSLIDVTSCLKKTSRYARFFLWPFSMTERAVRREVSCLRGRVALLSGYVFFHLVFLILIPFAIVILSGGILIFEYTVLVLIIAFFLATRECNKEVRRIRGFPPAAAPQSA